MDEPIQGLSSMATRRLLAELSDAWARRGSGAVVFESAGGVEVARRIRGGTHADLAVLSADAMDTLDADDLLHPGTLRPLFVSDVVAAVPAEGAASPFSTEDELRAGLLQAGRIAYSTGPSGAAVVDLIERWGLAADLGDRLVQVPPGTPVGTLLAGGTADLGFQQRSELNGVGGVRVLGPLPGSAAIRSTFSGAVLASSARAERSGEVLEFLGSPDVADVVRAAGMEPA